MFPAGFVGQGVLNKDPSAWPGRARPPLKYVCKYIKISLINIAQSFKFSGKIHRQSKMFASNLNKKNWSFAQIIFPANFTSKGVLSRELLLGYMELDHPP